MAIPTAVRDAGDVIRPARTVHVVGPPGAGKSTTAGRLAEALGVRPVHLDDLARPLGAGEWRPFGVRPPSTQRQRVEAVAELLGQVPRVTEGIYCGWADPLLDAADLVVWLDLSRSALAVRGLRRVWEEERGSRRGALAALARATWSYPRGPAATDEELRADDRANSRRTLLVRLARRDGPVVRCTATGQVNRLHRLVHVP